MDNCLFNLRVYSVDIIIFDKLIIGYFFIYFIVFIMDCCL